MTDIGPETVAETVERLRRGGWDTGIRNEAADLLEALAARLAEWQASQHYSYTGRDGKPVLARDLEDRLIAAEAEVARLKTAQGAAGVLRSAHDEAKLQAMIAGQKAASPTHVDLVVVAAITGAFLRALAQGE